ncbi:MAG: mechanosensitive ion channel [Ignavibacteria bacterium]|nr:mechanosensitive ion channel [Ignavibacteria bacterium]
MNIIFFFAVYKLYKRYILEIDYQQKLNDIWRKVLDFIPEFILGLIILVIFYFLAKIIISITRRRLLKKLDDILLISYICTIVKYGVMAVGFMIFLKIVGLATFLTGLVGGAAVSAIVIGFAFKDIIENFLAGIIMAFNRPFKTGDTIVVGDITGNIQTLNIRYTHLKTFDGFDVFIPNSMMINKPLINYTKDGKRRFELSIFLDYSADANKAMQVISDTIMNSKEVLKDPAVMILFDSFNPNYVILKAFYWVDNDMLDRSQFYVKSDLLAKIYSDLSEKGITVPQNYMNLNGSLNINQNKNKE